MADGFSWIARETRQNTSKHLKTPQIPHEIALNVSIFPGFNIGGDVEPECTFGCADDQARAGRVHPSAESGLRRHRLEDLGLCRSRLQGDEEFGAVTGAVG